MALQWEPPAVPGPTLPAPAASSACAQPWGPEHSDPVSQVESGWKLIFSVWFLHLMFVACQLVVAFLTVERLPSEEGAASFY